MLNDHLPGKMFETITTRTDDFNIVKSEPKKELTFGEKLVGLTFNPSNDDKVFKAKRLCAELADLVQDNPVEGQPSYLYNLIKGKALGEILNAQMNVVKVLTFKH